MDARQLRLLLGWLLCALPALLSAHEGRLTHSLDDLARRYTTPTAVGAFLQQEFTFRRDEELFGQIEYWQSPLEFLQRRSGDCEDYALLARDLLLRNGMEAYVFSLFGTRGYAHTVCLFVDADGRYNVINQATVVFYRAQSLEALAAQLYPEWTFGGIVEQEGTRGRLVREIRYVAPTASFISLDTVASVPF